jgi:hypothetical protein
LDISFLTYKRYAETFIDLDTGKSLYEIHKNKNGIGIPKSGSGRPIRVDRYTEEELRENQVYSSTALKKLKATLMYKGLIGYTCACCGFSEKRVSDMKVPLVLNFKNGKKSDWRIENLRWVCYNCSFLLGLDYFSNPTIEVIEGLVPEQVSDMNVIDRVQKFYDMDDILLGQFKKLGLDNIEDPKPKETPTQDLSDLIDYI